MINIIYHAPEEVGSFSGWIVRRSSQKTDPLGPRPYGGVTTLCRNVPGISESRALHSWNTQCDSVAEPVSAAFKGGAVQEESVTNHTWPHQFQSPEISERVFLLLLPGWDAWALARCAPYYGWCVSWREGRRGREESESSLGEVDLKPQPSWIINPNHWAILTPPPPPGHWAWLNGSANQWFTLSNRSWRAT